jgi:hypothetical protein
VGDFAVPRSFFQSTAEDVVASVEAVVANETPTSVAFVADFADIPASRAEEALKLAVDLGLLVANGANYSPASPLCVLLMTPDGSVKAAILRIALESYEPFVIFRQRLKGTELAAAAAQQTRTTLALTAHRDAIKDTLVSLGTYSKAIKTEGAGRYEPSELPVGNHLLKTAQGCGDVAAAEARIRLQMGVDAANSVARDDVLLPLANALLQAGAGDGRAAVVLAGNAVESYLAALGGRLAVALGGAHGINAKLDRFAHAGAGQVPANALPKKLIFMGKYLGNIRNAADHGVDPEVGATWQIQPSTGLEFVYVACSFISAVTAREQGQPPRI